MEEDKRPKGLAIARILAGITIVLNVVHYIRIVSADANIPQGGCGTGLVGLAFIQIILFIIMLCCVIPWIYLEAKNPESPHGGLKAVGICILAFLLCVVVSHCTYSDPNRPINKERAYDVPAEEVIEFTEEEISNIYDEDDSSTEGDSSTEKN